MLLVTDTENDEALFRKALAACELRLRLTVVRSPQEAVLLLKSAPPFDNPALYPKPRSIILNLRQAELDPAELLLWSQSRPELKTIAKVVISPCADPTEILKAYSLGANAVIARPETEDELFRLFKSVCQFWSLYEPAKAA
jgi:CheY-like chemotaxis protein